MATRLEARTSVITSRISGPLQLVIEAVGEIRSRHRLIRYLVGADLRRTATNTALGKVWWVLDPLMYMAVFTVLVTVIFGRATPDYPIFIFAGIVPWKWFATAVEDALGSVAGRNKLIKQVQFPKVVLPSAAVLAATYNFAFGLLAMALLLIVAYPHRVSVYLALIPVVATVQLVLTFAVCLVGAALNVFFRDLRLVSGHALRLWFYLSPVLWSFEEHFQNAPPTLVSAASFNPFYTIMSGYRDLVYYGRPPDFVALAVILGASLLAAVLGLLFFKWLEPAFAKVL